MKTKLFTKATCFFLFFIFLSFHTKAQLRVIKVNPATEEVTIKNFGSTTNITNYYLCNFPDYKQFNGMTIIGGGDFNLSLNEEVTITSTVVLENDDGELGLYNTNSFGSSSAMEDYMQWGTSGHTRESVAVTKGIWTAGTTITVSPPYEYTGDGTQNGSTFWGTALSTKDFALNSFSISPNPGKGNIHIKFPASIIDASIDVFDVFGKRIFSNKHIVNAPMDVSLWSNGMYLVKVSSEGKTKMKKFIKQ